MCLSPEDSSAYTPQAAQGQADTSRPSTGPATITVSGFGLVPGVVYQIAVTARDRVGCRILERVYLELPHTRPVTLELSCLPSQDPTGRSSFGQAQADRLPSAEEVAARIDIP